MPRPGHSRKGHSLSSLLDPRSPMASRAKIWHSPVRQPEGLLVHTKNIHEMDNYDFVATTVGGGRRSSFFGLIEKPLYASKDPRSSSAIRVHTDIEVA